MRVRLSRSLSVDGCMVGVDVVVQDVVVRRCGGEVWWWKTNASRTCLTRSRELRVGYFA